jgi:uncharacterized membrane protein
MHLSKAVRHFAAFAVITVAFEAPAFAYLGPGLGMGAVSVALGVVGSIFFGFFAVLWYPTKRLFRALRRNVKKGASKENVEN